MNTHTICMVPLALVLAIACTAARADDIGDAKAAGSSILVKLEQGKNKEVWNDDVSTWFKDHMTEDAFLANMVMIRAQLGAPGSGRTLIQQNKVDGMPMYNYKGNIYSFLFKTSFPTVNVYENIVIAQEAGKFKLMGINFVPNPN